MELEISIQVWVIRITRHELRIGESVHECQEAAAVVERSLATVWLLREAVATQKHVERRTDKIAGIVRLREAQAVDVGRDHFHDRIEVFLVAG